MSHHKCLLFFEIRVSTHGIRSFADLEVVAVNALGVLCELSPLK
ncbi:hypothetical protein [Marinomonas aquiplantarum]|uniref:Uncharacterized protein n=1 Tax=Marinomonas aquiplantarum TaxID=491951 RepID=A0A366D5K6_9GAMM|nr:hypothetical protein [Marinomonas aquiplantarum]RBO84809.1 hypothetical protein DFP76_102207 [Marinomonas aquiplantarum]